MTKQTQAFQAETKQILDLMIHSLYSHKEVFLRELISNASDAIEKLKFLSLTDPALAQAAGNSYEIRLEADKDGRTLTISDNGIGMDHNEVVQNIGTIAHSGTKSFLKMREEIKTHPELIGQFGVGFYSAFVVADRVTLHTQKAGTQQGVLWESDGTGTYTIEDKPREKGHGTTVTLHLRDFKAEAGQEDQEKYDDEKPQDFTDPWVLKSLIKKYSDFVAYPIRMQLPKTETKDGKTETIIQDETLNSQKALWLRPSSEITPQEYTEFYHHISHDWSEPLKSIHYRAEGTMEFVSVLYIPSQKPYDYDYRDRKFGLDLYVKRIFIKDNCEELLPPYLRFVQGVVDSDDLSLNVSREMLQQDRQITRIRKALTNKVLGSLKELLEADRPGYEKFWTNFGRTLKEGSVGEPAAKEKLQELMLFHSTHSDQLTTLKEYLNRMQPSQKAIYYIAGDNLKQLHNSPYLEKLKAKGFEVILMTDHVDSWVAQGLEQYEGKPLQSITAENLELNTEEEKKAEEEKIKESEIKLKPLLDIMKEALKENVKDIKFSDRLTESPVCLVSAENAVSAHVERIMESMGQAVPKNKRVMEINPHHPLFEKMSKASKNQQEEWAEILYQQALLNEGTQIENPAQYSRKITKLMMETSGSL